MDSAFRRSYRENLFAEAIHSACSPTPGSPAARGVMFDDPSEFDVEARDPSAAEIEAAIPRLRRALEAHAEGGSAQLALAIRHWRKLRDDHLTGQGRRLKAKADMVLRLALAGMRAGDSP